MTWTKSLYLHTLHSHSITSTTHITLQLFAQGWLNYPLCNLPWTLHKSTLHFTYSGWVTSNNQFALQPGPSTDPLHIVPRPLTSHYALQLGPINPQLCTSTRSMQLPTLHCNHINLVTLTAHFALQLHQINYPHCNPTTLARSHQSPAVQFNLARSYVHFAISQLRWSHFNSPP